jgi:O-antigen/teichoic acid export membrane protein
VALTSAITKASFIALSDQVISSTATFLTGVILGRTCSKDEFGLYTLGFSIIVFSFVIQNALISTPYTVFSPRLKGRESICYAGSTLIHQLFFSLLSISCLAIVTVAVSSVIGPKGLDNVLWALVVFLPFILLREFCRRMCFAHFHMKSAFIIDASAATLQISSLLLLSFLHLLSASRAFIVIGLSSALIALGWLLTSRRLFILDLALARRDLQSSFSMGKWVFLSSITWIAATEFYPWLLTIFEGIETTAIFGACAGTIALSRPIIYAISNILMPALSHAYADGSDIRLRRSAIKAAKYLSGVVALIVIPLLFFAEHIVVLVYGYKYSGYGRIVQILALNTFISASSLPFSRSLFIIERADVDFILNIVSLILTGTLGIYMVQEFAAFGAAISLLVSNSCGSMLKCLSFLYFFRLLYYGGSEGAR